MRLTVLLVAATIAACASGPPMSDVSAEIPPLPEYSGRLFFYGSNTRYTGLMGGTWRPKLNINGKDLDTPYGVSITFYVDVSPGPVEIRAAKDLQLDTLVTPGETVYVRMDPVKNFEKLQTYELKLTRVDAQTGENVARNFSFVGVGQWED